MAATDLPLQTKLLPYLLQGWGWTVSHVDARVDRHVPGTLVAHRDGAQAFGENGLVCIPHAGLSQSWNARMDDAAIASALTGLRWAVVATPTVVVVCDGWKRLALPEARIAWMDNLHAPRTAALLQAPAYQHMVRFPLAPARDGAWTHWMAPLGRSAHTGDAEDPHGPTAWLDAQRDGTFVLKAGSHVAMRFSPSLLARPDGLARIVELRAAVGLRATLDPDLLTTQQDSPPIARSAVASLVLGREANGQIAGETYGTQDRNDRDIWPK